MKVITKMIIGMLLFSFNFTQAQVELDVIDVVNTQKCKEARYYYYPNLHAYFDTKVGLYLYQEEGEWIESEKLAAALRGYSLKNGQYVIIEDYNGDEPYILFEQHKIQYPADYSSRSKRDIASN